MLINNWQMEWDDDGAVVNVDGFQGFDIRCPRCQVKIVAGVEHRCGNKAVKPKKKLTVAQAKEMK